MIKNKTVEANEEVGIPVVVALEKADIKIVGNGGGNISNSMKGVMGMFGPDGGVDLAGMLTGLASTAEGKAVLDKFIGEKGAGENKS